MLLDAYQVPDVDLVKELVGAPRTPVLAPQMGVLNVDLAAYDVLLTAGGIS